MNWRNLMPSAVIVVLGLICYANSFGNGFVWDDHVQVEQNRFLRSAAFVPRYFTDDLAEAYNGVGQPVHVYRPLWWLPLFADYQIWGAHPFGFHLTNLLFHVINGLLLFTVLRTLKIAVPWALFGAALFVCHPIQAEAVTSIASRATAQCVSFLLGSLLLLLRFVECSKASAGRLAVSVLLFGLALLSKETAVTYPLMVVAAMLIFRTPPVRACAAGSLRSQPMRSCWCFISWRAALFCHTRRLMRPNILCWSAAFWRCGRLP